MPPFSVRIGMVGAGAVAARHVRTLLAMDRVRVAAVADPVAERARHLADLAGATAYRSHLDMLDQEDLDALYICVPPFAHGAPELAAIEAGLPFFVEKPVAVDLPTAEAIAARLAQRPLVTCAGYHWRWLDTFERARDLLGDNPARVALCYWLDKVPPPAWWPRRDGSGGQTIEQTTHVLDLARGLVGEVVEVHAFAARPRPGAVPAGDVDHASVGSLRFAGGAVGSVASTCLLDRLLRAGIHVAADGLWLELSETELLVEAALELPRGARVLDVGTGSGAVALALKRERPDLDVAGSDVSADALAVARANAECLGLEVRWLQAHLLTGAGGPLDAVVANLPYVAERDVRALEPEITRHEPRGALSAGDDGLALIERLVDQLAAASVPWAALEVGLGQAEAVRDRLAVAGYGSIDVRDDLAGIPRVVTAR
jgi:predicted dehydrogenase